MPLIKHGRTELSIQVWDIFEHFWAIQADYSLPAKPVWYGLNMTNRARLHLALICCVFGGSRDLVVAQSVSDYAVRVSAVVQTNPSQIALSWPADAKATGYTLYRKGRDDTSWGTAMMTFTGIATSYTDTNVAVSGAYEYRLSKSASGYTGVGYIFAGIQVPLVESRGKVILLVDNTFTTSLATELGRLLQDLVGDGWTVLRHDVPRMAVDPANTSSSVWAARSNELANVKALITADYNADPTNVKAVFLFGHVPVPYSGDIAPDEHVDHTGAGPADVYYANLTDTWTDSSTWDQGASDTRNWNQPGDGKFDFSELVSDVNLQVGRVDLANLPAFAQSETVLLRQYLAKDHNFRQELITAQPRGLIDDNLGLLGGEKPAVNGWRNFAPLFGATNCFASSDWFGTLATNSYLWGYGCGGGTYTSASGVGSTTDFATKDPRVVFTMLFGSYFGDWDSQNNFLRAALGTTNYTLTSAWVGRPYWQFHHMALGETIGFSTRLSQNNDSLYASGLYSRWVHIALMGDPTLRMHIVAPPSGLLAITNATGGVDLSWNPSPDTVLGDHVYRAPTAAGPFTRLTTNLITGTSYTDSAVTTNVYMVRAVKLEVSASGSYYNASQGVFQDLAGDFGPPVLTIMAQSTNKVYGAPLPGFTALYSGFTNGDTPASLSSPPVLTTSATAASPPGNYPIHVSGAVSTNYLIRFLDGTLTIQPAATTGLLTSSTNPALPGQPVSFTLALTAVPPGQGTPTGAVQFRIDSTNVLAPVALSGGAASCTISNLTPGLHTVAAEYAGDGNFTGITNLLVPDQLINTPPVAGADTIERDPTNGTQVSIAALLSNDTDAEDDPITFVGVSPTSANGGTVVSNGGWVFYTPAPGFTNSDTFAYTISDGWGVAVTGTVTVNIRIDNGPSSNLTISDLGNGSYAVRGDGIPGRSYRIQFADTAPPTNWLALGTNSADAYGIFQYIDSNGSSQRFYRSVYP